VYPKKSNFSSGSLQTRVFVSFTVNFSFVIMPRILTKASAAFVATADHEVIGIINDGIPRGRWRPSGLGMYTRSTGWGWYLPAFSSAVITSRNGATPCRSASSRLTPSTPARFAGRIHYPLNIGPGYYTSGKIRPPPWPALESAPSGFLAMR
jgi:hypothetical protein